MIDTIIPAQPGWYVAEFLEGDENAPSRFLYDHIIAWHITVKPAGNLYR